MPLSKKLLAEFFGTFWLVFGGCGSAVLAAMFLADKNAAHPINIGIGLVGVSLAFGLTVMTMAYAIGHISGCHLNPAVSLGLVVAGRFKFIELIPYIIAQCMGAVAGAGVLYFIASGNGTDLRLPENPAKQVGFFATNGFGTHSPGGYEMFSCLAAEIVLAIGLGLTLIHLIGIPVTNLSVNPARSVGPAVMVGGEPLKQVWLFWAAPMAGAVLAGIVHRILSPEPQK
jgi:aquaporin Z